MKNQTLISTLQKLISKTDNLQKLIKTQNTQMSEVAQRQQLFEQALGRLQNKIDHLTPSFYPENQPENLMHHENELYSQNTDKNKLSKPSFGPSQNTSRLFTMRTAQSQDTQKGKKKVFTLTKELLGSKVSLKVHEKNVCLNQFEYEGNKISARSTGWYQLLMKQEIDFSKRQFFQIKLRKTQNKYIMIGISSLQRLKSTSSYDSGKAIALNLWNNHIYSKFGKEKRLAATKTRQGDLIKVEINGQQIQWLCNGLLLGSNFIVPELRLCKVVPYIQLYNQGDQIQLR